ncbi:MAG: tetratricopeptide repeat protein, partial [Chitinophagales bacterium]
MKSITHILFFSLFFVYGFSNVFQISPQIEVITEISIQKDTVAARHLLQKEKILTEEGDYQGAIKVLQQVYDLYSKHELWENAIQSVISLAKRSDNYDTADLKIKYANLSLGLAQQHLPKEHLLCASAFRQKAEALTMIDKLDSANIFLAQAVPIFTKHQSWVDLGWSELFLGLNYLNQYQLDNSHKHFKAVEELLQEPSVCLSQEDRTNIQSTLLSLLGLLYQFQGDYDKAIQNTQQALALEFKRTQLSATDSFYIRGYYNNLGALYLIKGDYQRSLDNFMLILSDFKQASKDVTLFSNIGELFRRQGNYALAIDYFQKSVFFEVTNEEQLKAKVDALNGLSDYYKYLGLYDSAMYYCQQAILLPTNYRKPIIWGMMGNIEVYKKSSKKALEYLEIAEKTYRQDSTADKHSAFVLSGIYRSIGDAHFLRQNFNTALTFYQKALVANHSTFRDSLNIAANPSLNGIYNPTYFWSALQKKAKTLASFPNSSKNLETALVTYQVLIQWTDSLQASHATETASLDWSGEFKQIYEEAISVAFR